MKITIIHSLASLTALLIGCSALWGQSPALLDLPLERASAVEAGQVSAVKQLSATGVAGLAPVSTTKWAVSVRSRQGRVHTSPEMQTLKASKMALKQASKIEGGGAEPESGQQSVQVAHHFEGNWSLQAHPPDNSIAVSNAGVVVSVNNDGVEYYDASGQLMYVDFWADFVNNSQLNSSIYDPVVLYDSEADRFVMAVLHGTQPATSRVLLLFSQSNDPLNGWHLYQLPGNPLNNNTWFDYPKLGVSSQEVYITGNLYDSNDDFTQSIIFQVEKQQGLAGGNINYQFWSNLNAQPFPAFTLVPTTYGQQGNVGPGMLFVSTRPGGQSVLRLWHITDVLANSPMINAYTVNVTPYSPAADAEMPNTSLTLDNGDCRGLAAFFLDQKVHFVFHSDVGQGWNGIYYSRIDINSLQAQTATLGRAGQEDFSYPVLASLSTQTTDPTAAIAFLTSSSASYPGTSITSCDANMQWSQPVQIKAGETYIDFLQGNTQRWGDYSGIARKHNSNAPEVWSATCYGADIQTQNGTVSNTYKTRIARITGGTVDLAENTPAREYALYPNPVTDFWQMEFDLEQGGEIRMELYNSRGQSVKLLFQDRLRPGLHHLRFNREALPAGTYFLQMSTDQHPLHREKITVQP